MLTEALFVPFLDNGNELLQERFGMTAQEAGLFLIIPYLVASGSTPFIGSMADKVIHFPTLFSLVEGVY